MVFLTFFPTWLVPPGEALSLSPTFLGGVGEPGRKPGPPLASLSCGKGDWGPKAPSFWGGLVWRGSVWRVPWCQARLGAMAGGGGRWDKGGCVLVRAWGGSEAGAATLEMLGITLACSSFLGGENHGEPPAALGTPKPSPWGVAGLQTPVLGETG